MTTLRRIAFRLVAVLAAPLLAPGLLGSAALPYSRNIPLVAPRDGATIEYASPNEIVTFSFHVDTDSILADAARTGDDEASHCGTKVSFFVTCEGAACRSGDGGRLARDNQDIVSVRVQSLLDLTTGNPAGPHAFIWGGELRAKGNMNASPPCVGIAIAATSARFTLTKKTPPPGPPDLALTLDPDLAGVWPKTVTVADKGGPSKPTFLAVTVKTLSPADPPVARNCALMDETRTHTVEALAGGGARRTFDVPPLKPSKAQTEALLHAIAPPGPTPTPAAGTPKAGVQPPLAYHDPNVHRVVTCQYALTARLGSDTNVNDPAKQNNSLSRTIRIDVPLR